MEEHPIDEFMNRLIISRTPDNDTVIAGIPLEVAIEIRRATMITFDMQTTLKIHSDDETLLTIADSDIHTPNEYRMWIWGWFYAHRFHVQGNK